MLNPKAFQDKNGKIIRKVEAKIHVPASNTWEVIAGAHKVAKECFYIQTRNDLIAEHLDAERLEANPETQGDQPKNDDNKLPF